MSGRLHAEDIVPGTTYDLGEHAMTLEEVVDFSAAWDPQDFHLDDGAHHFGGVIASGLHTMAALQRLAVRTTFRHWEVQAARRIHDVRFLAPVRPGGTLRGHLRVDDVTPRDAARDLVTVSLTATVAGRDVLTARHELYVFRRSPGPAGDQ